MLNALLRSSTKQINIIHIKNVHNRIFTMLALNTYNNAQFNNVYTHEYISMNKQVQAPSILQRVASV